MRRSIAIVVSLLASWCAAAAAPSPAQILSISQHVANWQLSHMGQLQPGMRPETYEPRGWVMGAFYVGLTALADQSADPNYTEAVLQHGQSQGWRLGPRPFHADDHVIGQTWIWAYEHKHDPRMIAPTRARFDAIIAAAPHGSLVFSEPKPGMEAGCQDRWCWCDALFMGPPGWFELSRATGNPKFAAYADKQYWATVATLFSPKDDLFYRDTRFIGKKGPHGEKIFWSRGNGWVYAGLARIIQFLPRNAPERRRFVDLFRKMSAKLVTLQKPDGYWPVSLEGPAAGTPPETSGTGFFTFGLAYGVASGILTGPEYRSAAERGWAALVKAVEPDGKLGWVQPIGAAPEAVARDDTQLYGVGAFLLAGSAMIDMERHPGGMTSSTLPVAGYAESGVDSVALARNVLADRDGYQFAAFYGAAKDGHLPVLVARRAFSHPDHWQVVDTGLTISSTAAKDDHNIIAMTVDASGVMHLSWGMHNIPLNYAVSSASVLGKSFATVSFHRATMIGRNENSVTYPEFLTAPNGKLLFTYRNGGSGNGNQYINAFNAKTRAWRRIADPMVDGISTSMNAYFNAFAFDAKGRLIACWTVRETPNWQTNHDLYCAVSSNLGRSWASLSGVKLGPPINRAVADAKAKILSLPAGSSLINQAGMTVDANGNPVIATWWAPRAAEGDNTRQYMLVWKNKAGWHTSVISKRPPGEPRDADGTHVRELARPIVLIDKDGTTYVVARSTPSVLTAKENRLVVYASHDRVTWRKIVLSNENPGAWEPTYDSALWHREHRLALFFQPLFGTKTSPVRVLTWMPPADRLSSAALDLTLHNPGGLARTAARVAIPAALMPKGAGRWVAVLGDQVMPLQRTEKGALTVLDIPAKPSLKLILRRRYGFDPPPRRYAHAAIPVKQADGYHEVQTFDVPPTHTIHDPLLPFEGAGWESDRVAYRVYLDRRFATDIYGKKRPSAILDFIGQGGPSYHAEDNAWGRDMWLVGDSLGAGGVGVLRHGMATQIGKMKSMKAAITANGPLLAGVRVDCIGITVGGRARVLKTDFTLSAGSRLSVDSASAPGVPLVAGFGKWPHTVLITSPQAAKGWAYFATWGKQSDDGRDDVGVALFYPAAEAARTGDDGRSLYVRFRNPAKAHWAFAAAWAREGGGIADEASFRAYLDQTAAALGYPVTVTK